MSNIDKQALVIPQREKHDWSQAVMRNCDFCQQWALTVRHSDGGCICASCCDSEYTTALSSALVVALDELEAKGKSLSFLKDQLAQLANFNPDWDKLEAATDSLREHMAELTAARKRIAELEASHSNLREAMAGIHNTITGGGAYTPLAAILNASKRAYDESAAAAGRINGEG